MHHDEAIAKTKRVTHIVRNHEGCELLLSHDAICEFKHLFGGLRVKRGTCVRREAKVQDAPR